MPRHISQVPWTSISKLILNELAVTDIYLQVSLEKECPDVMKLGLLYETETKVVTTRGNPTFVSFEHKSVQELAAAFYIKGLIQCSDDIQVRLNQERILKNHIFVDELICYSKLLFVIESI